ncbi:unnamed protein product [Hapterophycus canaliculatus]
MDTKVVQAVAKYASTQAAAGTSRLLLAASDAASPAFLLMGVNTTETQAALNDSVQLLSMGIVPDPVRFSPRLLSSFKDFDDDDKRLDAAFRRQRRRKSKPLPVRLLGSLPSTINKAADLAYEVEQEVKYERAGSRANKLLRPFGVALPQAKEKGILMGRTPGESEVKLLEAGKPGASATAADSSPTPIPGYSVIESSPAAGEDTPALLKSGLLRDASTRREPMPPAPHPFGASGRFRRDGVKAMDPQNLADTGFSGSKVEPARATVLASQVDVLPKELSNRITSVDEEVRLQARGVRAANAVLCSTELIIAGLEKSSEREDVLLEELRNVARSVQQMYVLAEMSEAVEAAERHLGRLRELSANVITLAVELQAYVAAAHARNGRLESIRSRLLEVRDQSDNSHNLWAAKLEFSSELEDILWAFDDEVVACQEEAKMVGRPLAVVRQESPERARNEAGNAHEYAFLVACRLWDASAVEGVGKPAQESEGIDRDFNTVQNLQVTTTPVFETEVVKSLGVANDVGEENLAMVSGAELSTRTAKTEQSRATEDGAARDTESSVQQARVTQVDEATSIAYAPNTCRAPAGVPGEETIAMLATSGTGTDFTRAPDGTIVDAEETVGYNQSSSSAEVVHVTVVYDATTVVRSVAASGSGQSVREVRGKKRSREGLLPEEPRRTGSDASNIEVVVDRSSSYVDVEAEVEEDVSEPTRIGLKFLDVSALLIEKLLFVGLPTLVSGGSLVWERVDNARNGAKGRKGWKLLKRLKKD